jgi:hypothetical protein
MDCTDAQRKRTTRIGDGRSSPHQGTLRAWKEKSDEITAVPIVQRNGSRLRGNFNNGQEMWGRCRSQFEQGGNLGSKPIPRVLSRSRSGDGGLSRRFRGIIGHAAALAARAAGAMLRTRWLERGHADSLPCYEQETEEQCEYGSHGITIVQNGAVSKRKF